MILRHCAIIGVDLGQNDKGEIILTMKALIMAVELAVSMKALFMAVELAASMNALFMAVELAAMTIW